MTESPSQTQDTRPYRRTIQIFWATEIALFFAGLQLLISGDIKKTSIIFTSMPILVFVYLLAKKGKEALSGAILLSVLTVMLLIFMWTGDGIRDEALFVFPAIICFSGLTQNNRLIWFLFATMFINILGLALANEYGIIVNQHGGNTLQSALTLLIILSVTTYAIHLASVDLSAATLDLIKHKDQLKDQVRQRTKELESSLEQLTKTRDQLVESEKMASLGSMVAGVAHEINTPIGIGVTASSHLVEQSREFKRAFANNELTKTNVERYIENVDKGSDLIQKNLNRAAGLIRNFKEAAVEQSHNQLSEFDVGDHIRDVLDSLETTLVETEHKIDFSSPEHTTVFSSSAALTQVINNLVLNSIKHGFEGVTKGHIELALKVIDKSLKITYHDNGIGMAPDVRKKIFEPFFTTKRGQGGSGLGMHIVYNLVTQSLGGTIDCVSELSKGTTFELKIPLRLSNQ